MILVRCDGPSPRPQRDEALASGRDPHAGPQGVVTLSAQPAVSSHGAAGSLPGRTPTSPVAFSPRQFTPSFNSSLWTPMGTKVGRGSVYLASVCLRLPVRTAPRPLWVLGALGRGQGVTVSSRPWRQSHGPKVPLTRNSLLSLPKFGACVLAEASSTEKQLGADHPFMPFGCLRGEPDALYLLVSLEGLDLDCRDLGHPPPHFHKLLPGPMHLNFVRGPVLRQVGHDGMRWETATVAFLHPCWRHEAPLSLWHAPKKSMSGIFSATPFGSAPP